MLPLEHQGDEQQRAEGQVAGEVDHRDVAVVGPDELAGRHRGDVRHARKTGPRRQRRIAAYDAAKAATRYMLSMSR